MGVKVVFSAAASPGVTCAIPREAGHIVTSFTLWGGGKVWLDTNSLELAIVK